MSTTDYIVQESRFAEFEDIGCIADEVDSILSLLLIESWQLAFPLVSALFYCRGFRSFATLV